MNIRGLIKTTLLDYPEHIAATVFLGGCNFRCLFCHNMLLVTCEGDPQCSEQEVMAFLDRRKRVLEGVCISGGEPTLDPDLPELCRKVKNLGLLVKLDTNGTAPDVIRGLVKDGLVDYVAMDIKAAPQKYSRAAGVESGMDRLDKIGHTINFLLSGTVDYEFRTTVAKPLHTEEDLVEIAKWIPGARRYFLQAHRNHEHLECESCAIYQAYSKEEMERFLGIVRPYVQLAELRGV